MNIIISHHDGNYLPNSCTSIKKINDKNEFYEEALTQFKTYLEHMRNVSGVDFDDCEDFKNFMKKNNKNKIPEEKDFVNEDEYIDFMDKMENDYINNVYENLTDMNGIIIIKSGTGYDFVSWDNNNNKITVSLNDDEYVSKYDFYEFILQTD